MNDNRTRRLKKKAKSEYEQPHVYDRSSSSSAGPPLLGWRSWNLYGANVNQSLMEYTMEGIAHRRTHIDATTGTAVSLCDLGYCDVGLDDNWQACNASEAVAIGMHYHDETGRPIVNLERFPDLKAMTAHAHALGLTAGWYHNNCICSDYCRNPQECDLQIRQDALATVEYGFDSVKLDGCGGQMDLHLFDQYLRELSPDKPILIENCHWGKDGPSILKKNSKQKTVNGESELDCPFGFYRTSGDIRPNYESVMHNLQSVEAFRKHNLSRPGCWAYPDMLQVGVFEDWSGATGLTPAETR